MTKIASRIGRLAATMALMAGLTAFTDSATAQAGSDVPVKISGSHCYKGGKLAYWKLAVGNQYTSGKIYGTSTTVPYLTTGKHQFVAQAWCRYGLVIGAGRSGSVYGWVYGSGKQPAIVVYLGIMV